MTRCCDGRSPARERWETDQSVTASTNPKSWLLPTLRRTFMLTQQDAWCCRRRWEGARFRVFTGDAQTLRHSCVWAEHRASVETKPSPPCTPESLWLGQSRAHRSVILNESSHSFPHHCFPQLMSLFVVHRVVLLSRTDSQAPHE